MTEKRFDFEDEYITLDGSVFATAKNRQDAELISRTLNQLYGKSEELKHHVNYLEDRLDRTLNQLYGGSEELKHHVNYLEDRLEMIKEQQKENEQLKERINSRLHFYRELYESTNDKFVERVIEDLEDILKR